jgi:acetyl-CoA synthetase
VLLNPGEDKPDLVGALKQVVREVIGPFAAPDRVHIAAGLPKTRSGKIMRRILRKVAAGEYGELGDVSTLADPTVVDRLIEEHQALG